MININTILKCVKLEGTKTSVRLLQKFRMGPFAYSTSNTDFSSYSFLYIDLATYPVRAPTYLPLNQMLVLILASPVGGSPSSKGG